MKSWILPGVIIILGLISVVTLKSVAPHLAGQQTLFVLVGMVVFWLAAKLPFQHLQRWALPLYVALCLALIFSYGIGLATGRPGRWIPIGLFNIQPSQLAIPVTALILTNIPGSFNSSHNLLKALGFIALPAVLIFIEPDLGTTIVYLISMLTVVFIKGIPGKTISILAGISLVALVVAWLTILRPYQKQRITSFINQSEDVQGANYNATQALIAVGSGQLTGRGIGEGIQSHLRFLPERQTDFIFASLAEEFGFIGASTVLLLYATLIGTLLLAAKQVPDVDKAAFTSSLITMTTLHVVVNIGMNIGIMPITGITLPFLSYGGSSILSLCAMYGVVQSTTRDLKPQAVLHLT